MPDDDIAMESAARSPATFDGSTPWLYDGDKVIHDSVGHRFIENAFVSEPLQIHFETLQFDAHLIGNVSEDNRAVVGLSRFRANRSKLGAMMLDRKVSRWVWIIKHF